MQFTVVENKLIDRSPAKWSIPDTIAFIKKNCSPFLRESKRMLVYRGVKSGGPFAFIGIPRKDRRPLDTDDDVHKGVDKAFLNIFGWRARSQAIFVTGDEYQANYYGKLYVIFPIGNFKYVYAPQVRDLYHAQMAFSKGGYEDRPKPQKMFDSFVRRNYRDTNLTKAIKSDVEIAISCKQYFALYKADWSEEILHNKYAKIIGGLYK
jgi:hypothetical protein